MRVMFSDEHIFLDREEIAKVSKLFEKEFGITNIKEIKATPDSFEIIRLCIDREKDSIIEAINKESIENFKKFVDKYNAHQINRCKDAAN